MTLSVNLMKKRFGTGGCLAFLAIVTASLSAPLWAEEAHPKKTMTAVRVNPHPPRLDGILDDPVWRDAPIADGFTQRDPDEGLPATENTTVQIAYDDEALYIGVMCYDSEPDKIVARLTRRDQGAEQDWVSVNLDPHHDHQTGNFFVVAPGGWMMDGILYDDTSEDSTWDGVWEAKAAIHDKGWSAEYKIPYHVLRFSPQETYTWGINVQRHIIRKEERDQWILVRKGESGWTSRLGHLEGISGIKPPRHLELLPFAVGRTTFVTASSDDEEDDDLFGSAGLDLRYGLFSNISLNATFNPDFGQVEADPAVLNLTVFETFFEERRPFFVEGDAVFRAPYPDIAGIEGPSQLFYSRRIGKQPGRFSIPDDTEERSRPDASTIIGAAKISGKTRGRTALGILEAVTANEYATIEQEITDPATGVSRTVQRDHRIEPLTNHFVGRVQQDLMKNSSVGATVTAVNGEDFAPAYVASLDSTFKWKANAYRVFTRLSGSRTGEVDDRKEGYETIVYFSKFSSWFGGQTYFDARSPDFEANALGFMNRNNRIQAGGHIYAQIQQPWALARRSGFNINVWSHWNYDGVSLKKGINFNNWHQLKNYWFFNFGISREFEAFSDLETRGGPVMVNPAHIWFWSNLGTDDRKPLSFWFNFSGSQDDDGESFERRAGARMLIRPASNLEFQIGPTYRYEKNFAQWVENIDDDGDGEDDHFVFGELKNRVLDITGRASVAFTTNLTLQLYLQPFVAVGDYSNFKELARPESYEFIPFTNLSSNPDFSRRSVRSNLVLRWEYQPGSTFFLVWSQSRSQEFDIDNPEFEPFDNLKDSFTDDGENIFLAKLNYWLGM